jgi:phosphoribosylglycinamide formyltransferase-1
MYKIGWFSTGRDEAARDLLTVVNNSINQGEIKAEIEFIFCNREPGESEESDLFIKLVENYHIPLTCFSYQKFRSARGMRNPKPGEPLPQWRLDYDREVMKRIAGFSPDLCVLAGYMLVTGHELCQKYDIINLHPAAPGGPVGTWQQVIWQLIENNARETGVLMFLVTPELDKGPPITYCTFPIRGGAFDRYWDERKGQSSEQIRKSQGENNNLFKLIREYGLVRESPLIVSTIKAFSQGKLRITPEKQVVDIDGRPINGYDLTSEINEAIKQVL